ncbi:hypothetical protein KIN20_035821 [Parelaphostrongylus tenuis]|uniref:Uncharacterized protein n=1 Tax=Parelaphostrongylus tenuis TaxID=148309 RepID=A0AAD5RBT6_PARTN|nr:hypothetical protein KIN20_035821 [Parelaphostrongylus tenuis]
MLSIATEGSSEDRQKCLAEQTCASSVEGNLNFDAAVSKRSERTVVSFLGTKVSYTPGSMSSLVIPFNLIPWRLLSRNDVMILKIEKASTQKGTSFDDGGHMKSKTLLSYADDLSWIFDTF